MELESHKYQIVVESSSTIVELAYRTLSLRTKNFLGIYLFYLFICWFQYSIKCGKRNLALFYMEAYFTSKKAGILTGLYRHFI